MKKNSPLGFKMPHNTDSIAATKHWKAFKSGYMNRSQFTPEYNKKEYDREKHEFYYDTQRNKLRLVPTDDGEVPMKGFKEKLKSWQLPPLDRKSPLNQNGKEPHADSEWENATYQLMNEGKISESDNKAYPLIEARVKANTSRSSNSPLHGAYSEGKGMHGAVTGTDSEGNTIEFGNVDLGGTAEDESAWRDSTQNLFNSVMEDFDKTEYSKVSGVGKRKYVPKSGGSTQRVPCKDGGYRVWDPTIGNGGGWTCKKD